MQDKLDIQDLVRRTAALSETLRAAETLCSRNELAGPFLRAARKSVDDASEWLSEAAGMLGAKPVQSIELDESRDVVLSKCICSIRFESYATSQNPHAHGPLCPRFNLDLPNEGRHY